MKTVALVLVLTFFSWKDNYAQTKNNGGAVISKLNNSKVKGRSISGLQPDNRDSETNDSLQLKVMMHHILQYASKHRNRKSYHKNLNIWNASTIAANLTFGHLFDPTKKHLIVRRSLTGSVVALDIFLLKKINFSLFAVRF